MGEDTLQIFREEAEELIVKLENSIMQLENNMQDTNLIEEIFRVMHTLKGNGKMFGFEKLADYTHELENIYDAVREGAIAVDKELINLTFSSIDLIRHLLVDVELNDKNNASAYQENISLLSSFLTSKPQMGKDQSNKQEADKPANIGGTYKITFSPNREILKSGNNPLFILDDLKELGELLVRTKFDNLPDLNSLIPDELYLSWECYLYTSVGTSEIEDTFMFVADESKIEIKKIADQNLLKKVSTSQKEAFKRFDFEPEDLLEKKLPRVGKTTAAKSKSSHIKVSSKKLDELLNTVSELITSQARLTTLAEETGSADLLSISENIDKISRKLREDTFSICLVPVSSLAAKFNRMVRDLSDQLDKPVDFEIKTGDTELDKNLVDKLSDPLMHILRNSIDHGLEKQDDRKEQGKNPVGKIKFESFYSGTNVVISISDDGKGLDLEKIIQKARNKGLTKKSDLTEAEAIELLFTPGFSTAGEVTDVSGRGVGLDVVKKNIEDLKGHIKVTSRKGEGTTFDIYLPLTLSIVDGLLVEIGNSKYTIPLSGIESCHEIKGDMLTSSMDDTVIIDGKKIPFIHLEKLFDEDNDLRSIYQAIIVKHEPSVAFVVDNILQNHQAVIQPMGDKYNNEMFSGASILGDGTVSLVVDYHQIIQEYLSEVNI